MPLSLVNYYTSGTVTNEWARAGTNLSSVYISSSNSGTWSVDAAYGVTSNRARSSIQTSMTWSQSGQQSGPSWYLSSRPSASVVLAAKIERERSSRKAEALLRAHLKDAQVEQLERYGWFDVTGRCRTYRINRGRTGNVYVLDAQAKIMGSLCAHPLQGVPDADTMLAQALMLQFDETAFLEMANLTPPSRLRLPAKDISLTPLTSKSQLLAITV